MNIETTFPQRFYINLSRRQDRRFAVRDELEGAGLEAERFPAVDGKRLGAAGGFGAVGYHALAITNRMVLREASLRGAAAVLMLEDDVVFHPRFLELAEQIELPDDWEMFFFGCKHVEPPEPAWPGLVKVTKAWDWHAVAFRERAYLKVRRALARLPGGRGGLYSNDQRVGMLQKDMPTYAAWPNLAWQRVNKSDLTKGFYSAYRPDGRQAVNVEAVKGLDERMAAAYGLGLEQKVSLSGGRGTLLVRLNGGLGNQMFQYAFGQSLAWDMGMNLLLCGRGLAKENVPRTFALGMFGLGQNAPADVQGRHLDHWHDSPESLREEFYNALRNAPAGLWEVNGYFQNEALFARHSEEIRRVFRLEPIRLPVPEGDTRVCLQIRRGDYTRDPAQLVCTEQYYLLAMRIMASLVPNPHFIVVSDAMEWCRGFLPQDGRFTFHGNTTEEEDQRVMLGCESFIISNSTCGWWPAWLTKAPHVIRPACWMNGEHAAWSIFPERWISLPC